MLRWMRDRRLRRLPFSCGILGVINLADFLKPQEAIAAKSISAFTASWNLLLLAILVTGWLLFVTARATDAGVVSVAGLCYAVLSLSLYTLLSFGGQRILAEVLLLVPAIPLMVIPSGAFCRQDSVL
jgi:hypothetical protein